MISEQGMGTDPQKTEMVSEWPTPTCTKELRSFLGLASYYRRLGKEFATLAAPLHRLTRKNAMFQWNDDAQASFEALKAALISPPILAMSTDADDFTLDTDESDFAIGAVLSQRQNGIERVIAYASRSLDRRVANRKWKSRRRCRVFCSNFAPPGISFRSLQYALVWRGRPDEV